MSDENTGNLMADKGMYLMMSSFSPETVKPIVEWIINENLEKKKKEKLAQKLRENLKKRKKAK